MWFLGQFDRWLIASLSRGGTGESKGEGKEEKTIITAATEQEKGKSKVRKTGKKNKTKRERKSRKLLQEPGERQECLYGQQNPIILEGLSIRRWFI